MMGTGAFAEPTFVALLAGPHPIVGLVTKPDKPVGDERGSTRQTGPGMAGLARARDIPVFQPEFVNDARGVVGIRDFNADLLVVAAYGHILSKEVLEATRMGGINVHASLLPKYRGAAPVAWAIYHGETRTGVTIIRMTTGLDAGDMLAQEAIDIGPDETAGELEARLAPLGARLAMQVVDQLAAGTARGVAQDNSKVTKAPKLKKEHGLIDWTRGAFDVRNQIRAMQPWPTAYTFLHQQGKPDTRVIIYRVNVIDEPLSAQDAAPGSIVEHGGGHCLLVAAGSNEIMEVAELQPAGKRRMTGQEFLLGHRLKRGDCFGPAPPA
jgi:methionyl-tRNA formyltransferase